MIFGNSTYTCPYCFEHSDNGDSIWFQCSDQSCAFNDKIRFEFIHNRSPEHGEYVPLSRYVFEVPGRGLMERLFTRTPQNSCCPACGQWTATRACQHCHSALPDGIGGKSNMVIAIVGDTCAGKSNYIAVLIQRIRELYKQFGWTFGAADCFTDDYYKKAFHKPLYVDAKTVCATLSAHGNIDARRPLLYSLDMAQGNKWKSIILSFFDTCGTDLHDHHNGFNTIERMMKLYPCIYNATGIILLADPLNFPEIREKVKLSGISEDTMFPINIMAAGNIIERVINLIQCRKQLGRDKKIDIPLAVTFSKIDLLKTILGGDAPVFQQSLHNGVFSLADFQNNNDCFRDWIYEYDPQLISATRCFKDAAFFGVSALGGNPDKIVNLPFAKPLPIRVEDPLLWLLWKNGFLKGI